MNKNESVKNLYDLVEVAINHRYDDVEQQSLFEQMRQALENVIECVVRESVVVKNEENKKRDLSQLLMEDAKKRASEEDEEIEWFSKQDKPPIDSNPEKSNIFKDVLRDFGIRL